MEDAICLLFSFYPEYGNIKLTKNDGSIIHSQHKMTDGVE
jgi:hypothetical protein